MKRFMFVIALLLFAGVANAAQITLAWDPMPSGQTWTKVRAYERFGVAGSYTYSGILSEVNANITTCTFAANPGAHGYVVRSFDGTWESNDSNAVTTTPVPTAPTNNRIVAIILAGIGAISFVAVLIWSLLKKVK